jgi:hypothetical protein
LSGSCAKSYIKPFNRTDYACTYRDTDCRAVVPKTMSLAQKISALNSITAASDTVGAGPIGPIGPIGLISPMRPYVPCDPYVSCVPYVPCDPYALPMSPISPTCPSASTSRLDRHPYFHTTSPGLPVEIFVVTLEEAQRVGCNFIARVRKPRSPNRIDRIPEP